MLQGLGFFAHRLTAPKIKSPVDSSGNSGRGGSFLPVERLALAAVGSFPEA